MNSQRYQFIKDQIQWGLEDEVIPHSDMDQRQADMTNLDKVEQKTECINLLDKELERLHALIGSTDPDTKIWARNRIQALHAHFSPVFLVEKGTSIL